MRELMETVSALYVKPADESAAQRASVVQHVDDDWRLPNLATILPREHLHPIVALGKPEVTIYRAVPATATEIRPGDWVALVRATAAAHQRGEDGHVISIRVPADDVAWAGTDRHEYHYVPRGSHQRGGE